MNDGKSIFSQLMDFIPRHEFDKCVKKYNGNYKSQTFTAWNHFLCMAFAQLTGRESLRDTEICLKVMQSRIYHMGFRGRICKSTIGYNNEHRDWRIFADLAQILIRRASVLYSDEDFGIQLSETVYALDSTTIDLCLSMFPWAKFRTTKAAVKMHTLLNLRGNIPSFIQITDGSVHDVKILDELITEPGAFYVMDRGYLDFFRLYRMHQNQSYFVIRWKRNVKLQRVYSRPVDKATGLICDQTVRLTGTRTAVDYPDYLRRVKYRDIEEERTFVFLTNNFSIQPLVVADIYKNRWMVELFFKWIKQHLRIKTFFGTSENAVKLQIWIAVTVYVLVAIVKKELGIEMNLYTILQILSVTVFEKISLNEVLTEMNYSKNTDKNSNQLLLF
jgi:hypothetical protein